MCLRSRQRDTTTLQCDSVLYVVSSVPVERHYLRFQQRDTISGSSRETLSPVPAERQYYTYRVVVCCGVSGSNRETLSPVPAERHYLRFQQRDITTLIVWYCAVLSPVPTERHCLRFQQRDTISGSSRERHYYAYRVVVCCGVSGSNRETLSPVPEGTLYYSVL